ncbi:putative manganese transporter [Salinisphaera sp. T31B1]|uniref:putative manganese transporter n=1 Tax=Salinisphaera sp. T31B1 TaxID=727963 RepID=UPI0033400A36
MMKQTSHGLTRTDRIGEPSGYRLPGWRWAVPLLLAVALFSDADVGTLVRDTLAEAYLQVSVFVAATLMLLYTVEQRFSIDLEARLAGAGRAQVPLAAGLGLLPGCGGAIVVVTQFVNGRMGFGGLVAVLIATMGDAAFLLIAAAPGTAGVVLGISLISALVCGWTVDAVHGPGFLRPAATANRTAVVQYGEAPERSSWLDTGWVVLWIAGLPLAIAIALQQDPNSWFGGLSDYQPATWLGCSGAMLALIMWAARADAAASECNGAIPGLGHAHITRRFGGSLRLRALARRARPDTNFVTVWVVAAFLVFELSVLFTGTDPAAWFDIAAPLMPLAGVVVGFIPGCGPQILLTTLYLSGVVPMSTLAANAISNDGDALFPALALAPRAALLATLYSALPALLVGYAMFLYGV